MKSARLLPLSLIALGVFFVFLGVFRSEINEVFRKASVICLECIGIG